MTAAPAPADDPNVLLLHDGELEDVETLICDELGLRPIVRRGAPALEDLQATWDLVIGSPRRLLESDSLCGRGTLIAVMDEDSRTLRASLKRSAIDFAVRRPVHPTALRLLILHTLYRGPEKRRSRRVSVGAPVRLRLGLRRREAVLADLSSTGCRLIAPPDLHHGRKVHVQLGPELTGGRPLNVGGRILRSTSAGAEAPGSNEIAMSFDRVSGRRARRLAEVVARFARGPATLDLSEAVTEPGESPADSQPERRRQERHEIPRRIISLDDKAARVLMGRDISLRGMRVDPHPDLELGAEMKLALHVRAREAPLVVCARVERDDGDAGCLLAFGDLDEASRNYLEKMVRFLPILATRSGDGEHGVILSEILEGHPA